MVETNAFSKTKNQINITWCLIIDSGIFIGLYLCVICFMTLRVAFEPST